MCASVHKKSIGIGVGTRMYKIKEQSTILRWAMCLAWSNSNRVPMQGTLKTITTV
jgi:hypothetical protein